MELPRGHRHPSRQFRAVFAGLLMLIAVLAAACGPDNATDSAAANEVRSEDGRLALTVPPAALPDGTTIDDITIEAIDATDDDALSLADGAPGKTYRLEPDGLQFSTPVTLTVVETLGDPDPNGETAIPILVQASGDDAVPLGHTEVELDYETGEARLSGEISHFSRVASLAPGMFWLQLDQGFRAEDERPVGGTVTAKITVRTSQRVNRVNGGSGGALRHWLYLLEPPATLVGEWAGQAALGPASVKNKPTRYSLTDSGRYDGQQTFTCLRVGAGAVWYKAQFTGTMKIERYTLGTIDDATRTENFSVSTVAHSNILKCVAAPATATGTPDPTSTPPATPTPSPTGTPTATATNQVSRAPTVSPIDSSLSAPTTTYTVLASDPDGDRLTFTWSGTNCGTARPLANVLFWDHGSEHGCTHEGTDHRDATITVVVSDGLWEVKCIFTGSASGTGQTCSQPRALF